MQPKIGDNHRMKITNVKRLGKDWTIFLFSSFILRKIDPKHTHMRSQATVAIEAYKGIYHNYP